MEIEFHFISMEFRNWSIEEVAEKLSKAGLGMFSAIFIAKNIIGEMLETLTSEDLHEMGIGSGGQEMILRWIANLTPIPPDERPVCAAPPDETWMSRLDDQYELMEPKYRDGTLRRPCAHCNRQFGLHRIDRHEVTCPSQWKSREVSPPQIQNSQPREPSKFREAHEALRESIWRAKHSFLEIQPKAAN
jgi:hypothetical protein